MCHHFILKGYEALCVMLPFMFLFISEQEKQTTEQTCVYVSGFIILLLCLYAWTADYLFDIQCQTVIEDDHLLFFLGTSQHKGPVLLCSHIQVQFQLTILGHTKAQSSHTHTAAGEEEKTLK